MRDSLANIEREAELRERQWRNAQLALQHGRTGRYPVPQRLLNPIGRYDGQPIHEFAIIDGRQYRFAHVCPTPELPSSSRDCAHYQWIAPGLVYVECAASVTEPSAA